MRSVVFGKIVHHNYSVDYHQKDILDKDGCLKTVYTSKPELIIKDEVAFYKEILSFDGQPYYNKRKLGIYKYYEEININENETVMVIEEVFRADLNEIHIYTSKVLEEVDVDKEHAEYIYTDNIKMFNEQMINSNKQMLAYCKLHHLEPADTDCIELFNVVYPDKSYEIVDGEMKVKEDNYFMGYDVAIATKADLSMYQGSYISDYISTLESRIATSI